MCPIPMDTLYSSCEEKYFTKDHYDLTDQFHAWI